MQEFVEWMMLEAKAGREGMPVDSDIGKAATSIDHTLRAIAADFLRFANERRDEIERWGA